MGSDLYMEAQNWGPRPNKGEWDGDELVIFHDQFYHGYTILWRGEVNEHNISLVKVMLPNGIPPKPPNPNRMPDSEFLSWLADRLVNVYDESPNVDFVRRLRDIALRTSFVEEENE